MERIAIPADTSLAAHRRQGEIYARMGGSARLALAFQLTDAVRRISQAGIRDRHPDYTEPQVFQAWARLTLGDRLVRAIWPDRDLVDP